MGYKLKYLFDGYWYFEIGECWAWKGELHRYHRLGTGANCLLVHRVVYEKFIRKLKENEVIDHLCMNKGCVNPNHLEAVTIRVNTKRGREAKGSPELVVSNELAAKIIEEYNKGNVSQRSIAEKYRVSQSTVSRVVNNKQWIKATIGA